MADYFEITVPRMAYPGRTFVYVLPCREEDTLKVGFSRDPLQRMQALHRRYFEFFDLDRALLVEVEKLRDARGIERRFITHFAQQRAQAPLVVRQTAGGRTEWFRGVAEAADALARSIASDSGFTLHAPLRSWLQRRFSEHSDALYDYSNHLLDSIEYERFNLPAADQHGRTAAMLRDLLDNYAALDVALADLIPPRVMTWYENGAVNTP